MGGGRMFLNQESHAFKLCGAGSNCGFDIKHQSCHKSRFNIKTWEPCHFEDQRTDDRAKHNGKGDIFTA